MARRKLRHRKNSKVKARTLRSEQQGLKALVTSALRTKRSLVKLVTDSKSHCKVVRTSLRMYYRFKLWLYLSTRRSFQDLSRLFPFGFYLDRDPALLPPSDDSYVFEKFFHRKTLIGHRYRLYGRVPEILLESSLWTLPPVTKGDGSSLLGKEVPYGPQNQIGKKTSSKTRERATRCSPSAQDASGLLGELRFHSTTY